MNTDYTYDFAMPDRGITDPGSYRRIQAWREMNASTVPEATNGQPLTSILTASNAWLSRAVTGAAMSPGGWFSWNVIAPASGLYQFRLETTGSGTVSVRVDDAVVALSGAAGSVLTSPSPVFITKGLHTLRVLTQGGTATLVSLTVSNPGQPTGFNGLTASPGNTEAYLRWNAVSGAIGYHVYYKNRLESTFTRFTTAPITATQFVLTGLLNNTTYQVVATYVNSSGVESSYSNQVSVVPSENPPLLAWEFDNSTSKTSGNLPATLQSMTVGGTPSIVNGPARAISTNSYVNEDGIGWGANGYPTALDPNLYFGFALTPATGKTLRLTRINIATWVSGTGAVLNAELRVSTNNFSTFTVVPLSPAASTIPPGNLGPTTGRMLTGDLSGISALQNIAEGTTVSFRMYLWGTSIVYTGLGKVGDTVDDIVLFGFPVDPNTTEMPVASVGEGVYAAPLSVTLSSATPGAQIRYTTDGSTPTPTEGTLYAGPIELTTTTHLRAIAYATGKTPSAILSRNYTIAAVTAAPQFSPPPGIYDTAQQVSLTSSTTRASIRYTTDGSTPTPTTGTLYTAPFVVSSTTTVRAIAYKAGNADSAVVSATYTITAGDIPAGTFLQSGTGDIVMEAENFASQVSNGDTKTWTAGTAIAGYQGTAYIATADTGAASPDWGAGTRTNYPVRFSSTGGGTYYIWARARAPNSSGNEAWFGVDGTRLGNKNSRFNAGSTYNTWVWVRHGNTFTASNNQTRTINLERYEDGLIADKIVLTRNTSSTYLTSASAPAESARQQPAVATPVAIPVPGVYVSSVEVTLLSGTAGASIRYTIDGTTPTSTTGILYTGPFTLNASATVRAIAYKAGNTNSQGLSFTYTVVAGSVLAFGDAQFVVDETGGSVQIPVRRLGNTSGIVTVNFATADGLATAGQDYTATSGTLTWANGDAADKMINIPILNDAMYYESIEDFSLSLLSDRWRHAGITLPRDHPDRG